MNGETERVVLNKVHPDGPLPPTELQAFGEFVPRQIILIYRNPTLSEAGKQSGLESSKGISEFEYGSSLGEFSMGSYGDLQSSSPRLESHYGAVKSTS